MNKKKIFLFLIFLMGIFLRPVSARAGDINGNEQSVLSYVSGAVFEYQGESYVAKEEYINQLRAKFMQDDIDLTQKEANNAIMQINANVKAGVTDGYLRKVNGDGGGQAEITPTDETEMPETPTGEAEVTAMPAEQAEVTDSDGKQGENKPESGSLDTKKNPADAKEKTDVDDFVQKVLSQDAEAVKVSVEQDNKTASSIVTVEQYLPSEMTVLSSNGEILFQGSLPIKNTGYETKETAMILFTVFYCGFLIIIISKRMRGSKNET